MKDQDQKPSVPETITKIDELIETAGMEGFTSIQSVMYVVLGCLADSPDVWHQFHASVIAFAKGRIGVARK